MFFALPGRPGLRAALFICVSLLACAQNEEQLARKSQQVKELMSVGRFADAVPLCEELVKAMPANPGLRLNLGLALHMSGRHAEAVPQFEAVLKSDPNSIPALISAGAAQLELNQPAKAIAPLSKVVQLQPQDVSSRGMLANALLSLGRAREAAPHFRKLTELTPADPKAWYGLGRCYEALAQASFTELDKTAQGSAEWLALVAESRLAQAQFRAAFFLYKQALAKDPKMRGLHAAIAAIYSATNHSDWAEAENKKEMALPDPDCAREKAECDFAEGRFIDVPSSKSAYWSSRAYNHLARAAFAKLGSLPESVDVHALKAEMFTNRGRHREAVAEWRAALKLAPGAPRLTESLLAALHAAKEFESSLALARELLKQDPKNAALRLFAGDSLLQLGRPEDAIPDLQEAARLDSKLLPANAALGLALARTGKFAEAVPHLERSLELDDDGSLYYQLSRAYQAAGQAEKSRAALAKYQEIQQSTEATKRDLEDKAQITPPQ